MTFVYDVVLNFSDRNLFYESYEWDKNDIIVTIRKGPLFKISKKTMYDFINFNLKVSKDFLKTIFNKCLLLKKDKNKTNYLAFFSTGDKCIGVSFDDKGYIIYRSALLFDEEIEINKIASKLEVYDIKYVIYKKINNKILTREDIKKSYLLLNEIKKIYNTDEKEILKYIYYEIFNEKENNYKIIYEKIVTYILNDFNSSNILNQFIKKKNNFIEN